MAFSLPALPYARNALAPHISENTLNFHYGKHHQAYVDNLNKLVAGTPLENQSLEEVVRQSWAEKKMPVFNNSGQVWNHTFYWHSMKPNGGGQPTGAVAEKIKQAFGDYDDFKKAFAEAGATQFGSGWAWLVAQRRQAGGPQDGQRRNAAHRKRRYSAANHGCLGARLLPRFPERPPEIHRHVPERAGELGLR